MMFSECGRVRIGCRVQSTGYRVVRTGRGWRACCDSGTCVQTRGLRWLNVASYTDTPSRWTIWRVGSLLKSWRCRVIRGKIRNLVGGGVCEPSREMRCAASNPELLAERPECRKLRPHLKR